MNPQEGEPATSPERKPFDAERFIHRATEYTAEFLWASDEQGVCKDIILEDLVVWLVKNRGELVQKAMLDDNPEMVIVVRGQTPRVEGGSDIRETFQRWDEIGLLPTPPTTDEEAIRFIPDGSSPGLRAALVGLYKSRRGQGDSVEQALEYTLLKGAGK